MENLSKYKNILLYLALFFFAYSIMPSIISFLLTLDSILLIKLITIDGLIIALNYFKIYINNDLTESQIIYRSSTLYSHSLLDRMIYYILLYLIYLIICNILWLSNVTILYFFMIIISFPVFLNKILDSNFFRIIQRRKEKIIKTILSKQITALIKFISKIYLKKNINITYKELLPIFDNYEDTISKSKKALLNAFMIIFMVWLENYAPNIYSLVLVSYSYKTGIFIEKFNTESAKQKLTTIIEQKKWNEILKPNFYGALFYLYKNSHKSDILNKTINFILMRTTKIGVVWTISSFQQNLLLIPVISLGMKFYRKNINIISLENAYYILILIIGSFIGFYTNNYLLTILICQCGYTILYNKIIFSICKYFYFKIVKKTKYLIKRNSKYNIKFIIIFLYIYALLYLTEIEHNFHLINIIYLTFVTNDIWKKIIYITLMISGYISNFNPIHLLHNILILYILMGIYNIKKIYQIIIFTKQNYKKIIKLLTNLYKLKTTYFGLTEFSKYKTIFDKYFIFFRNKNILLKDTNNSKNKLKLLDRNLMESKIKKKNFRSIYKSSNIDFIPISELILNKSIELENNYFDDNENYNKLNNINYDIFILNEKDFINEISA